MSDSSHDAADLRDALLVRYAYELNETCQRAGSEARTAAISRLTRALEAANTGGLVAGC